MSCPLYEDFYTSFIIKLISLFSDVIKINKKMRIKRTHRAVSEIIGTILLLGISVSLFSVVYIFVLTVPYSPPTPSVNIICQIDDGNIILSHYGGKALNLDSKIVLIVDGQPIDSITAGDYLYNDFNGDGLWSMGEKVVFSYASLVSGGEQIEVNILDTGSNSLVLTGTLQEEIDSVLSICTSVDAINPYELTSSPFDITATGPLDLDNVTLYYRWSDDNISWDGGISGEAIDAVDSNTSDVDSSVDKGIEANFVNAQDISPDSDYMNIQEEDTGAAGGIAKVGTDTSGTGTALNLAFSHTLVAGSNRIVVVYIGMENGNTIDVSSVTYGGVGVTKAVDGVTGTTGLRYLAEIWYILEADLPSDGSQTVSITCSGQASSLDLNGYCAEYTGVNQGPPEATDNTDEPSPADDTIENTISPSANSWVFSVAGCGNAGTDWTHGGDQTEIYDFRDQSSRFGVAELRGATGAESSLSSTFTSGANRMERVAASFTAASVTNYMMDFEYQWTSADYDKDNSKVCIYVDSHTGSENLYVKYRNGASWTNLDTISSTGWNNFTATGLISSTYTIQLVGATESSDSIQDNWDIDCICLHTWNSTGGPYGWTKFGTDTSHTWNWSFDFPIGIGYYQFYSIGQKSGLSKEIAPAFSDAICKQI